MRLYSLTAVLVCMLAALPVTAHAKTVTTQMTVSAIVVDGIDQTQQRGNIENDILEDARKIMAAHGFLDVHNLRMQGDFILADTVQTGKHRTLALNVYNGNLSFGPESR